MKKKIITSLKKAANSILNATPILLGVIILISIVSVWIPKEWYSTLFSGHLLTDSIIGSALGSILAGNPITSYILGGELLNQGIGLIIVTAFLVSWVTVGIIQMPAESALLGKKFAILRNSTAFIFSIFVAILTVLVVSII